MISMRELLIGSAFRFVKWWRVVGLREGHRCTSSGERRNASVLCAPWKGWAPNALYKQTHYYLRSARQMDFYALAAWNARVCLRAFNTPPSVEFEPQALTSEFMHELAHLSTLTDGPRHAIDYLDRVGVSLIVEPQLPETYIDGAAILASPTNQSWP